MGHLAAAEISGLLTKTLLQKNRTGFADILEYITKKTNSYGCILWQVAPGRVSPKESLFVLAQWFKGSHVCNWHNLPIGRSLSGKAIMSTEPACVSDLWEDDGIVFKEDPFLREAGIRSICSVPLQFLDGASGTVNLYRQTPGPFAKSEIALLQEFAELLPSLYQAMRIQLSLDLVSAVSRIQRSAGSVSKDSRSIGLFEVRNTIQRICDAASEALQCEEVSVFMKDSVNESELFNLVVTTWKDDPHKISYRRDESDGLTGWILAHATPVKIYDLGRFDEEKENIRKEYPGITWGDPFKLKSTLMHEHPSRIFSFMAVPVMHAEEVIGILRCNTARRGPGYFTNRDIELLRLLAEQIGFCWGEFIKRKQIINENKSWHDLVKSLDNLNAFVHKIIADSNPDVNCVIEEGVRLTRRVIPGMEISLEPSRNVTAEERKINLGYDDHLFRHVFVWPTGEPKHTDAETMIELLTQQMVQFCKEIITIIEQRQTFENLAHELRSPILQARSRAEQILKIAPEKLRPELSAIQGLCGRAKRAALNTEFFGHMAGNKKPPFRPALLRFSEFIRLLTEAVADKENVMTPRRNISFDVNKPSFEILRKIDVFADGTLLEQAIRNLVDNAEKYSFADTTILIHGGTFENKFHISIDNTGLPILENEVTLCTFRGWRSEQAQWTTGEGNGIGLWIVDQIMKQHNGQLIITPTTSAGLTQIHLVLPFRATHYRNGEN